MACTAQEYVRLYDDPCAQLAAYRNLIQAMDDLMLNFITDGAVRQYSLNDGQIIISKTNMTLKNITDGRLYYEQKANELLAQLNGRNTTIRDCNVRTRYQ